MYMYTSAFGDTRVEGLFSITTSSWRGYWSRPSFPPSLDPALGGTYRHDNNDDDDDDEYIGGYIC